ncbi:DUF4179 domain-containing protein [Paenibacillus thiaminolyticus]|uniref:DUF4179 domain-containing protein n=1 Tax=Paenibacillus thiaminolyticus TaxID=49283 RepID=UPI0035A6C89E
MAWVVSTAAALILIIGIYEYPAFAYYGSKLVSWTSLSCTEVAEHGYGQRVDKSTTLDDGTVITINSVVADFPEH